MSEQEKKASPWKLVEVSSLPVVPGVPEARERWQDRQVWCLTPWGQWRRGKVLEIGNDGFVSVLIYQKGTRGLGVGCTIDSISDVLRLVSE